jgi:hypothetical protein
MLPTWLLISFCLTAMVAWLLWVARTNKRTP